MGRGPRPTGVQSCWMPIVGVLAFCAGTCLAAPAASSPDSMNETRLARSSNVFGFDLYGRLRPRPGNLVFSPASITTALVMTWAGARGATAAEMKTVLHLDGEPGAVLPTAGRLAARLQDPSRPILFRIANRLYTEKTAVLEPAFVSAMKSAFGAGLEPVDFRGAPERARGAINGWVEQQTEKRILDLIPPGGVTNQTRLALVNALYFLGDWDEPFDTKATRPAPFHLSATQKKDVPTMHRTATLRVAMGKGHKAVSLPYKGAHLSMLVVMPEAVDGLGEFESSLTADGLDAIVKALAPRQVALALPKLEVNPAESTPLADLLKAAGMASAFDPAKADFLAMANPKDPHDRLYVGNVFHKAFVKVDEKGTEAAAATSVQMLRVGSMMAPRPPEPFLVDRPFLFFIRDEATGLVIFMGRVQDPTTR